LPEFFRKHLPTFLLALTAFLISWMAHAAGLLGPIELATYDLRFKLRGPLSGLRSNSAMSKTPEPYEDNGNGLYDPGEPYTDIGNQYRNENEPFDDCGIDALCPDDEGYTAADPGENNGRWDEGEKFQDRGNGRRDSGQQVVLVEIDDESFRLIPEPYPYGRGSVWARAVRNLTDAGAKVIVFDLLFDNPDHQTLNLISGLAQLPDEVYDPDKIPDGDADLMHAMREAREKGVRIILGAKRGFEATRLPSPDYLVHPTDRLGYGTGQELPYTIGVVDHPDDLDGVSRKYMMFTIFSEMPDRIFHSIALEAVLQYTDRPGLEWTFIRKENTFHFDDLVLDAYRGENAFLLNYYGPASNLYQTFNRFSLSDVLDTWDYDLYDEDSDIMDIYIAHPRLQPFRDKIVIIGSSLLEDHDFVITPYYSYDSSELFMPGLETHANAIQQIIDRNFISVPTFSLNYTDGARFVQVLMIFLAVSVTLFLMGVTRPVWGTLLVLLEILVWLTISMGVFMGDLFWLLKISIDPILPEFLSGLSTIQVPAPGDSVMLPVVFPITAIVISYGLYLSYRLIAEYRDKQYLRQTFGTYISPDLINQMYRDRKMPKLGGSEGHHSAFFSDIQGFSSFSEKLEPEDLVELLNEYLTEMTNILLENQGTLDKYIGDAIVAFFGAPMQVENHERAACFTAVQMQARLVELHGKWRAEGDRWPEIVLNMRNRIGINSGRFVTGNMGSGLRMNYTMIGDVVNTASRLESSAKQYGVYIQVSEQVYNAVSEEFTFRKLDNVIVVGKAQPVRVFELISEKKDTPELYVKLLPVFHEGIELYQQQRWTEAIEKFRQADDLEEMFPGRKTNPSRVYIARCTEFMKNPPGEDWDGVYRLSSK